MGTRLGTIPVFVVLMLAQACGREASKTGSPVSPTASGAASSFSLSGIVSENHVGPIANATITTRPNFPPGNGSRTTVTDSSGHYAFEGLTGSTILDATKDGYEPTGYGAFNATQVVNIPMNRLLQIPAGASQTATIWGDDSLSGEDWSGANCDNRPPCKQIHVIVPTAGTLRATLEWTSPTTQLGVYISTGLFAATGAVGQSGISVSAHVQDRDTLVIIKITSLVTASQSQMFTLSTEFERD